MSTPESHPTHSYPRPRGGIIIVVIVFSLLGGVVGGGAVIGLAKSDPAIAKLLGVVTGSSTTNTVTYQNKLTLEESSAFIDTAKKVSPSVVSVLTSSQAHDFFGNVVQQNGGGTGFVITSDGLIVTNRHVVSDTTAQYTVVTSDGKSYPAKILALDPSPQIDLAVLKINATGLKPVELGDSDNLQVGQWVVAIGNALAQFDNSVTVGVVSAKNRQITAQGENGASEQLEGLIQTDAAINPGNSGGPLVNLAGQVVGINTATSTDAQGIGFAIPINVVKSAIASVEQNGKIVRPILGVRYEPITKSLAQADNLPVDHGAILKSNGTSQPAIVPGDPAAKAGLQENDIITALNGQDITETQSLAELLQQYKPGDEITLSVLRDGKTLSIQVTLGSVSSS